jgi:hypothetical protein
MTYVENNLHSLPSHSGDKAAKAWGAVAMRKLWGESAADRKAS